MFEDEAGFGRINKPKYCWCYPGLRPTVPCHHIREFRYAYGAVEPKTGEGFFLVLPYCNTACMNVYLRELSEAYKDDFIMLVADGAANPEVLKYRQTLRYFHCLRIRRR
jgi:putative transposase